MRHVASNYLTRTFIALIALATVGCSGYSEDVFVRQNKAAATLARMTMVSEPHHPEWLDNIYAAEDRLQSACGAIRHVALKRMNDETVSFDMQLDAVLALEICHNETTRIEDFIRLEATDSAKLTLN